MININLTHEENRKEILELKNEIDKLKEIREKIIHNSDNTKNIFCGYDINDQKKFDFCSTCENLFDAGLNLDYDLIYGVLILNENFKIKFSFGNVFKVFGIKHINMLNKRVDEIFITDNIKEFIEKTKKNKLIDEIISIDVNGEKYKFNTIELFFHEEIEKKFYLMIISKVKE